MRAYVHICCEHVQAVCTYLHLALYGLSFLSLSAHVPSLDIALANTHPPARPPQTQTE
jgi:hypothetical protein